MSNVARSEFAPDLDLVPDAEREHGSDADPEVLTGKSQAEAREYLKGLTLPERLTVLFGVEPFDYQRSLCEHVENTDTARVAIQPGRQVGKTLIGAALAADDAARVEGEDTLIAAPFQETADEMMREAVKLLEEADARLQALNLSLGIETKNKRELEFAHGGRLLSRTLGVDGVGQRGKSPQFVIVDEASYVPDSVFEDVIEPFFLTHDTYTFVLTSTPSGDAGYFYERVATDDDWHSPYWPSALSPLVDPEWLADKRQQTDPRTFKQEYLGEFIGSSDRFFNPGTIDDVMDREASATRRQLALGADIARAGDDRTVIIAVGAHGTAEVLVSDADMSLSAAASELARLFEAHDVTGIAVDATGLGAGVVEMLGEDIDPVAVEGIKFSLDRKQSLYNRLKNDLSEGSLTLAYDGQLLREMRQLEYSLTGRGKTKIQHPDGGHDDHCDSLALASHVHRGGMGDAFASDPDNVVVL
jgi:hypothetical protein